MKPYEIKNKALAKIVKELCLVKGIRSKDIGDKRNFFDKDGSTEMYDLCREIFKFAKVKDEYAHAALCGIKPIECTGELSWRKNKNWNWSTMYDLCMLNHTMEMADKFMNNDQRCEVGMKYPQFDVKKLIKAYGLTSTGLFEPQFSKDRPENEKTIYEVWQNADRTISFSFKKGRMGNGDYAGATFQTFEQALKFTKWFLKHKSFYVKDWDIFDNRLGGMGLEEIDQFNAEWKHERTAYLKEVKDYTQSEKAMKKVLKDNEMKLKKKRKNRTMITVGKKEKAVSIVLKKSKYAVMVESKSKNPVRIIKV